MPDRLKRLKRLRETWELRKKAMEHRIAATGGKLASIETEEEQLFRALSGEDAPGSQFPDIVTRRLVKLGNLKAQTVQELENMRKAHLADSLNLRRSEILEDRQRSDVDQREESAALEATIEVFLAAGRNAP